MISNVCRKWSEWISPYWSLTIKCKISGEATRVHLKNGLSAAASFFFTFSLFSLTNRFSIRNSIRFCHLASFFLLILSMRVLYFSACHRKTPIYRFSLAAIKVHVIDSYRTGRTHISTRDTSSTSTRNWRTSNCCVQNGKKPTCHCARVNQSEKASEERKNKTETKKLNVARGNNKSILNSKYVAYRRKYSNKQHFLLNI